MIRIESPHLGVGIPTDVLARLSDAGPNTIRLRDLYLQMVMHVAADDRRDLTVRRDEVEALAAPGHTGISDAGVLVDLDILERTWEGFVLAHVDVYQVPFPGGRRTRTDAILGYAQHQSEPFTPRDIANLLGMNVGLAGNYLGKLTRDGRLDRIRRGHYTVAASTVDDTPADPQTSDESPPEPPNTPGVKPPNTPGVIDQIDPGQSEPRARVEELKPKNLTTNNKTKTTNKTTTALKNSTTTTRGPIEKIHTGCDSRSARRIPDPFTVDDSMRTWAQTRVPTVDVDAETEDFVDYWASKPNHATKLDWVRTWQMWMRKAARLPYSARISNEPQQRTEWRNPECPPDMDLYGDEYAALKRRAKAEWIQARSGVRLAPR